VLQLTVEAWADVYRVDIIERVTRAQYTATLRAMHALARKYPHRFVLEGGKGWSRLLFLVIGVASSEGQDHAGAVGESLPGDEHRGRGLIRI
jgi:hypothetical protein